MYSSLLQNYINQCSTVSSYGTQNKPAQIQTNSNYYMPSSKPVKIKVQTPEDLLKREKKKKVAKIALGTAAIFTAAIGSVAAFRHTGGIVESAKIFFKGLKKNVPTPQTGAFSQEALQDLQKGANNINNAKDSVSRHFLKRFPGYARFDNFVTRKYKEAALNTTTKGWAKAKKSFNAAHAKISEAIKSSGLDEQKASRIEELLSKRASVIESASNADGIKQRFKDVDASLRRLDKDGWDRIVKVKEEGFLKAFKKLSREALAEGRINDAKEAQNAVLSKFRDMDLTKAEMEELRELLSELKAKSKTSFMSDFIESNWQYKRAASKESKDLFDKLRDINYGCAPTDIINMGITAGILGVYTAQADSKEERVGVTLTTGIPLIVTLATTVLATNKMIAGVKAMGLGLTTGFIAKKIGGKINEKYKEKHNIQEVPKTIVTIDDYTDSITNYGENILNQIY